jgi:transcription termination factor NusB
MLLSADPSLAEVPDLRPEQLASLARGVERKQQQLEADIHDYIRRKQDELRSYGREVDDRSCRARLPSL